MPTGVSKWENRAAILAGFRERGVQFRLTPSGMQYRDSQGVLLPEEQEALDLCRPGLTEYLRKEAGVCIQCGQEPPSRHTDLCLACLWQVVAPFYYRYAKRG